MLNKILKLVYVLLLINASLSATDKEFRIVSLDGSATEILFTLKLGNQIVGRQKHLSYPKEAQKIKVVGDHGSLDAEGVLSLRPTHLILSANYGEDKYKTIKKVSGIKILKMPKEKTIDVVLKKIDLLAKEFKKEKEAKKMIADINTEVKQINDKVKGLKKDKAPKVLCLYLRGPGTMFILGNENGACGMVKSIGAKLCFPDLKQPIPLNDESIVKANPDAFVVYSSGLESVGGLDSFLKMKSIKLTVGGKNKRVVAVNGTLLSGFGPRSSKAALQLLDAIHNKEGFVEVK